MKPARRRAFHWTRMAAGRSFPQFLASPAYWYSPLVEEDVPMTMQIAIVAKDGLVLASDTKYRPIERHQSDASIPSGLFNAPKIFLCEHHSIAVAFAGWTDDVFLAGEELAGHLDAIPIVNDQNIRDVLVT